MLPYPVRVLTVGLTGGIASGKSMVSLRLQELGAVVIDSDLIAREVVARGTPGLDRLTETFGTGILREDGSLDRAALARLVFGDDDQRRRLNDIVHPLVRARSAEIAASVASRSILVKDIPLLVETGQAADFHLVVVVEAPRGLRLQRMVANRGMDSAEALARMSSQATDEERREAADVVIGNDRDLRHTHAQVDRLWLERLVPFAENLNRGRCAAAAPHEAVPYDATWPGAAARLSARILRSAPDRIHSVQHMGDTAVRGRPAVDVIGLQVTVDSAADVGAVAPALAAAGFPPVPGSPGRHGTADPGRPVEIVVTASDTAGVGPA